MKKRRILFLVIVLLSFSVWARSQELIVYPVPDSMDKSFRNDDFSVYARNSKGDWKKVYVYNVKVDQVKEAKHQVENASMCSFDFSGEVEVAVVSNKVRVRKVKIRPLSYAIKYEIKEDTVFFRMGRPANISVEINEDIFHNLHLFANPVEQYIPKEDDKNLIYFGPGIHRLKDDKLIVESGKTVFIAGGAVLMGQLIVQNVRDVKILGRGIIDPSVKMGIRIANSKNILIEGVSCTQCATGGSDSVTIKNVKSISYFGWGDGMNVFASSNVLFDGVFCRNSDDCTTVYATRMGFAGGCKNITMQNSTLWADVAHPILIGTHGNASKPDTIENIVYKNIDILDQKETQVDYQGCMAIDAGDNNFIHNVMFDNIRVEDFRQGQLVNLRVFFNKKYCAAPGKGIENVLFRNVTYTGKHAELSIIEGYDDTRKIKNIVFENLIINGEVISDDMKSKPAWYKTSDMARFFVGEHVDGLEFRK